MANIPFIKRLPKIIVATQCVARASHQGLSNDLECWIDRGLDDERDPICSEMQIGVGVKELGFA